MSENLIDINELQTVGEISQIYQDSGVEIKDPEYITQLSSETKELIVDILVGAVEDITSKESLFTMQTLIRNFIRLLNNKINVPKDLSYIDTAQLRSGGKSITKEQLRALEESKAKAIKNSQLLKPFLQSKHKDEIQQYLIATETDIQLIGNPSPDGRSQEYYTTKSILQAEKDIIDNATAVDDYFNLSDKDKELIEKAIDKKRPLISDEQISAVYECTNVSRRISIVEGVAGAGKSFTMEAVNEAYEKSGFKVMGTALSWNAAGVLKASAKIKDCRAIEGFVMALQKAHEEKKEFFDSDTLIIVDEAGLVGVKNLAAIIKYTNLSSKKIKIVLTGDTKQLEPVSAGNSLALIKSLVGSKVITKIRRQHLLSHQMAVYALMGLRPGNAINYFYNQGAFKFCQDRDAVLLKMVHDFVNFKHNNPGKTSLILAKKNDDVNALNIMVRDMYKKMGWIYGQETEEMLVTDGSRRWKTTFAVGDEVALSCNDKNMPVYEIPGNEENMDIHEKTLKVSEWTRKPAEDSGVFNRNTGRVIGISKMKDGSSTLIIEMTGEVSGRILLNTEKYGSSKDGKKKPFPVVHNFATTIYGSQGQTVDMVFFKDDQIDFRLAYVGASRHRKGFNIYVDEQDLTQRINKKLQRKQAKEVVDQSYKKGEYDLDSRVQGPVERRFRRIDYLKEIAFSWGQYSEKETVYSYEKKELSKNAGKYKPVKQFYDIAPEKETLSDGKEGDFIQADDTCVPAYVVTDKNGESILSIAEKLGVVNNAYHVIASNSLSDRMAKTKLLKWIEDIKKINTLPNVSPLTMHFEEGFEIYTDEFYHTPEKPEIDFVKLNLMTEKEMDKIKQLDQIDSYEEFVNAHADRDNTAKIDHKKMEELLEEEKRKEAEELRLVNPSMMGLYNMVKENEKRKASESASLGAETFDFDDYTKTDRYKMDISKVGGGLNRKEIELGAMAFRRDPEQTDIPLIPREKPIATVDHKGDLIFESMNLKNPTSDQMTEISSFKKFMKSMKNIYWGVTKHKKPLVFATNVYQNSTKILSKYDFSGECVYGNGEPFIMLSSAPDVAKTTVIVPTYESAMKSHKFYLSRLEDELSKDSSTENFFEQSKNFHNIIWGAKGVDWGLYVKDCMENKRAAELKKLVIIVGKEPSQNDVKWAKELQEKLYDQYDLKVKIGGNMPEGFVDIFTVKKVSDRAMLNSQGNKPSMQKRSI